MPSINHYMEIHDARRLCINTCEGQVSIIDEEKTAGKWHPSGLVALHLTRHQTEELIQRLGDVLPKFF